MARCLIDLAFATCWLSLTALQMLAVAVLIKRDLPGPVLYVPLMIRLNGKPFRMPRSDEEHRTMHAMNGDRTTTTHEQSTQPSAF
jgi:lipopolysaccharide/colanic/teichoic acid biosynthesis glycosyltransferase